MSTWNKKSNKTYKYRTTETYQMVIKPRKNKTLEFSRKVRITWMKKCRMSMRIQNLNISTIKAIQLVKTKKISKWKTYNKKTCKIKTDSNSKKSKRHRALGDCKKVKSEQSAKKCSALHNWNMNNKTIQNLKAAITKCMAINSTLRMTVCSYQMMMSMATTNTIITDSIHSKILILASIKLTRYWLKSAICKIVRYRGTYNEKCCCSSFRTRKECSLKIWMTTKVQSSKKAALTSTGVATRTTKINIANKIKYNCSKWVYISTLNSAQIWKSLTTTKMWPKCTDLLTRTCTRRVAAVPEGSIIPIVARLTNKTSPSAA